MSGLPPAFFEGKHLLREDSVLLVQGSKSKHVTCLMFADCVLFMAPNKIRIPTKAEFYAKIPPVYFSVSLLLNDVPDDPNMVDFSFVRDDERTTVFVSLASREAKQEWVQTIRSICEKMVVVLERKSTKRIDAPRRLRHTAVVFEESETAASAPAPAPTAAQQPAVQKAKHKRSKSVSIEK